MSTVRLKPGDHIQVKEKLFDLVGLKFDYYHHGIVVGVGNEVIHFTTLDNQAAHMRPIDIFGDALVKMVVQKDAISKDSFGVFDEQNSEQDDSNEYGEIEVVEYKKDEFVFPPNEVVERAEEIYRQYSSLTKEKKYVEVIERIYNPNVKNKKGDEELLEEIYSKYPEMKFVMQPYHIKGHNCEHIARYIKTGTSSSTQKPQDEAEGVKNIAAVVLVAAMISVPLAPAFALIAFPLIGVSGMTFMLLSKGSPQK